MEYQQKEGYTETELWEAIKGFHSIQQSTTHYRDVQELPETGNISPEQPRGNSDPHTHRLAVVPAVTITQARKPPNIKSMGKGAQNGVVSVLEKKSSKVKHWSSPAKQI